MANPNPTTLAWVVKNRETGSIQYGFARLDEAIEKAEELNDIYQTDAYKVEGWQN